MRKLTLAALVAVVVLGSARPARAEIKLEAVTYKQGKTVLEGVIAYDDALDGKRPGVLVVHDWMGVSDHTRERITMLAKLGYVAFAADIYGKGVRPADGAAAGKLAGTYKADRKLLRARARAGLDALAKHKRVDAAKLVVMGFCFGGTTALELARSGAPLVGTVSFHGGLSTPAPGDAKNIKGKVLALHGADDPFVPEAEVSAFAKEMRDAGVDWQLVAYGGAVHSFTNRAAGTDNTKGAAYNEKADLRSWEAMRAFFAEVFR